ncbi:hypothetical protein AB6C91_00640 [Vibrio cyclitrophicus]
MAVTNRLVSKMKVILEEEARLGFITEEERRTVVETLEKEADVKQTTATE